MVLPAGRAIHFKETKCFVNYSTFDGDVVCECEAGYIVRSCYPCLKIYVVFYTGDNENLTVNGSALSVRSILHEDLWSINSKVHNNLKVANTLTGMKVDSRISVRESSPV